MTAVGAGPPLLVGWPSTLPGLGPSVNDSDPEADTPPPLGGPDASTPSIEARWDFGFLGFGHTSLRSAASALRRSYSDLVGLPRFFLGGSTGLIVTGPGGICCCCPLMVAKLGGRG